MNTMINENISIAYNQCLLYSKFIFFFFFFVFGGGGGGGSR